MARDDRGGQIWCGLGLLLWTLLAVVAFVVGPLQPTMPASVAGSPSPAPTTVTYTYDATSNISTNTAGDWILAAAERVPGAARVDLVEREVSATYAVFVAADTAASALERGAAKVPDDWGPGLANRKGVGTRWTDPSNPGNGIRIDQGTPGVGGASQQVDHVVVRSGGQILGPDGKPIVGSLAQNPQAHIPLSDWLNWSSWNTP